VLAVTPAERHDLPALADLMEELDRFYGATEVEPLEQRTAQIEAMLSGDVPVAYVLLARDGEDVVGFASYSFLWPAVGLTHSLYLKELYVRRARQREGIGGLLMQKVCELAVNNGCSRVEWTTDNSNADAQRFYEALGASVYGTKVFYRIEEPAFAQVANLRDLEG
jgi:ribosomal protein S18 acetylase RimI-like enzyme